MTDERSDAEVIAASWVEPEIFGELFRRHYRAVYAYAVRTVGPEDGSDVAAEVFVRAFGARRRFDTNYSGARPWLLGIAAHLVSNHYRKQGRQARAIDRLRKHAEMATGFETEIVDRLAAQMAGDTLRKALANLRRQEWEVVSLFALSGLSYREISQALGISEGTVKSRLNRGRTNLRNLLRGFGELVGDDSDE